ncbi:MAG TPA: serine/threonine-protein kinase [Candidatus Competibacteraceae bacterium]|nr:serine/threonine-protein kinase [Candidatus Competibacteraceae bacterium]
MAISGLCMGCMSETGGAAVCPQCGFDERTAPVSPLYLPPRTVLQGRYTVGRVLGEGGFGITYLGWDHTLAIRVAIKEFLPRELAARGTDGRAISAYRGDLAGAFQYGLEKFLEEARVLARFAEHQGIVAVRDFFPAHGTGYLVMSYLEGLTLKDYLARQGGRIAFKPALAILMPVMDALRSVHEVGLLHRDISPDNIFITRDRQVKLIDFGAARAALGAHSRSLSVILKPGYAPPEQYGSQGRQGPWTDVYAVGATLYQMLTGEMPPEAPDRLYQDTLKPPTAYGADLPQTAELALFKALAVRMEQRFQSVADLQAALVGRRKANPSRLRSGRARRHRRKWRNRQGRNRATKRAALKRNGCWRQRLSVR